MLTLSRCDNEVSSFGMHELRNRGYGAPIQLPTQSKLGFHMALLLALLAAVSFLHSMNTQLKTWTCKLRNREKLSAEVGSFTTSVSTGEPNMTACKCIFSIQQLGMYSTSTDIFSLCHCRLQGPIIALVAYKKGMDTLHTHSTCAMKCF